MVISLIVFDILILIGSFMSYFLHAQFFLVELLRGLYILPIIIVSFFVENGKENSLYISTVIILGIYILTLITLHAWVIYKYYQKKKSAIVLIGGCILFLSAFFITGDYSIASPYFGTNWKVERVTNQRVFTKNPLKNYYYFGTERLSLGTSYTLYDCKENNECLFTDKEKRYSYDIETKSLKTDAIFDDSFVNLINDADTVEKEITQIAKENNVVIGEMIISPDRNHVIITIGATKGSAPQEVFVLSKF